jgi:AcrR family transcriptional regulator
MWRIPVVGETSSESTKRVRRRNPEKTRELILETASKLLAKSGPDGVSVSAVANLAKINRGTAYHHFQTREELTSATMDWVSNKLTEELFGDSTSEDWSARIDSSDVIDRLIMFAMKNPEFGPAWLRRMRFSGDQSTDPFWMAFTEHMRHFSESDIAEENIDVEVHSFMVLVSTLLWPLWQGARELGPQKRKELQKRFSAEVVRMSKYGIIKEEKYIEAKTKPKS